MTRTKCPICGGELLGLVTRKMTVVLDDDCSVNSAHYGADGGDGRLTVTCENDHDQVDMQEHVQSEFAQPVPGEERLDISGDPVGDAMKETRPNHITDPDGTVRVWDEIAGHYTLHHSE
jgi:hypothetical protein